MKRIILLVTLSIVGLNSFCQIGTKIKYSQMENPATSSVNLGVQTFSAGAITGSNVIAIGTLSVGTTQTVTGNALFSSSATINGTVAGVTTKFNNNTASSTNFIEMSNTANNVNSFSGYAVSTNNPRIGYLLGQSSAVTLANAKLGIAGSAVGISADATPIVFSPNGINALTNAMVINTSNNVGIGSGSLATLPASLSVYGTMSVSSTTTLNGVSYIGTNLIGANLVGSATLDFASTVAGAVTDMTLTVTGASAGDVVSVGVPNGSMPAAGVYQGWVSATNVVSIRFANNALVTTYDPASGTFKATVNKN